ncbi:type II secretory pathway component PulK [Desulfohalotomaculum tongense]|uniref:hypothetical protein n=1 Tax=Desulforadius tongensis TaxID=1216062 RepID=UPI0019586A62|nr:hypothetical protein [Desulforadius tongensis]MBM7854507.1 type II secretory pathway component PulK [Desulforadius tongensis]
MQLNNRHGHVMLLVMVVLAVVLMLGSNFLLLTNRTKARTILNHHQVQVYYIADAGVEMVLARLKENFDWQAWAQEFNTPVDFNGGRIKIKVQTVSKTKDQVNVKITSEGYYKQGKKTLVVKAQLQKLPPSDSVTITILSWKEKYGVF